MDRRKWRLFKLPVSQPFRACWCQRSVYEWMKTRQWGPGENKTLVWMKLFSFVLVSSKMDIFKWILSLVEVLMWMKGWISNLEHSEVRPSYIPHCRLWNKTQPCSALIRTREQCPSTSFWVLVSGQKYQYRLTADLEIAVTLSWRFRRLTVTTLHRYTSKLANWYWFTHVLSSVQF